MSLLRVISYLIVFLLMKSCVQAPGLSTFTELGRTITTKNMTLQVSGMSSGVSATVSTNGQSLSITGNGTYKFKPIQGNSAYNLIVSSVTAGYNCAIASSSGTLSSHLTLTMTCGSLGPYTISAKISGITASNVSLSSGSDHISNSQNGTYTFASSLNYGAS